MPSVEIQVPRLLFNTIRNGVKTMNFHGYRATLEEGSGWFSRPMWITFDDSSAPKMQQWLKALADKGEI